MLSLPKLSLSMEEDYGDTDKKTNYLMNPKKPAHNSLSMQESHRLIGKMFIGSAGPFIKLLDSDEITVNYQSSTGLTPLMYAARVSDIKVIEKLFSLGAFINSYDIHCW